MALSGRSKGPDKINQSKIHGPLFSALDFPVSNLMPSTDIAVDHRDDDRIRMGGYIVIDFHF
jgi:hypothetical protein